MTDAPRPDAVNTNVGLLSDSELYEIYLKALGYPKTVLQGRGKEMYNDGRTKRALTLVDAILLFCGATAVVYSSMFLGFVFLILAGLSVLNITAGPLAGIGLAYYLNLDSQQVAPPSMETSALHSPGVLAFIAEYLARPITSHARTIKTQLNGELELLEKYISQAQDVTKSLYADRQTLTDPQLMKSYDMRIDEALALIHKLVEQRNVIAEKIADIDSQTEPIDRQIRELQTLSKAGQRLKTIRGFTDTPLVQPMDEETALTNFAHLSAQIEVARGNLAGVTSDAAAYEGALEEVRKLGIQA